MPKNSFLISILTLSVIANCIFIYSKYKYGSSFKGQQTAIVDLFSKKQTNELIAESLIVNPFETFIDVKGTSIYLNSLIGDSKKLILIISDNSCGSCTELCLKALQNTVPQQYNEDILVLGLYERKREFYLLSKQYPFRFFFLSENSNLKEVKTKSPVFFVLDNNFKMNYVFIPVLEYQILTERYLDDILKIIKR